MVVGNGFVMYVEAEDEVFVGFGSARYQTGHS